MTGSVGEYYGLLHWWLGTETENWYVPKRRNWTGTAKAGRREEENESRNWESRKQKSKGPRFPFRFFLFLLSAFHISAFFFASSRLRCSTAASRMTGGHEDTRKRVFIRTVQQINGWQDRPQTFSARVPPA